MQDIDQYQIGGDNKLLQISSWKENRALAIALARQCRRFLDIISRQLDPFIFNNPEFIEALRQLIGRKRRPQVRILVFDPESVARNSHQIIEFAGHYSSFIEMRKASEEYTNYNAFLVVADATAWLHRNNSERYEGTANFNDRKQSKLYLDGFNTMWHLATPDPNLRLMKL